MSHICNIGLGDHATRGQTETHIILIDATIDDVDSDLHMSRPCSVCSRTCSISSRIPKGGRTRTDSSASRYTHHLHCLSRKVRGKIHAAGYILHASRDYFNRPHRTHLASCRLSPALSGSAMKTPPSSCAFRSSASA